MQVTVLAYLQESPGHYNVFVSSADRYYLTGWQFGYAMTQPKPEYMLRMACEQYGFKSLQPPIAVDLEAAGELGTHLARALPPVGRSGPRGR